MNTIEYHSGAWEAYVRDTLYPRALEAEKAVTEKREQWEAARQAEKTARLNDAATFGA